MHNARRLSAAPALPHAPALAVLAAASCALAASAVAAEPAAGPKARPQLHLAGGGYVAGALSDSASPDTLRWQPSSFVTPFTFPLSRVRTVHWPPPESLSKPSGDYCFELAAGDVVFGSLVGLDEDELTLDVPRLGQTRVRRSHVHRISRWRNSKDLIYLGPNGLTGWRDPSPKAGWREESGQLVSDQEGATIRGDLGLTARTSVEFELSWKSAPDFVLALGVGDDDATAGRAFRFEVWDGALVVHRETEEEADVASLQKVHPVPGRAHLHAFLDQPNGQILVFSPDGRKLADLKVAGGKPKVLGGVRLENKRGDVRLESLRIGRWDGELPRDAEGDRARVRLSNGSVLDGQVLRFEAAARAFVVRDGSGERRVAEDLVVGVSFPAPGLDRSRTVRAVYPDGTRLSGSLTKVENDVLWVSLPGFREPARLPVAGLRSLISLRLDDKAPAKAALSGRIELEGTRLPGHLVDGRELPGSSSLVWHPDDSLTSSPLRPGSSGRIVYREPAPPPAATPPVPAPRRARGVRVIQGFLRGGRPEPKPPPTTRRSLYLQSGDMVPVEVTKIDDRGVWFKTPVSESTFVPNDKVKAVELAAEPAATVRLNKSKRERLLTLPRMQRENPPTHLIRSMSGDYLRGRLLRMDDKALKVEVRLETKEVPRDRVSRIIWLHPESLAPNKKTSAADERGPTRVQAVRSDGIRLTFFAEKLSDATLSGKSEVLGACQVRLGEVEQLLIGGEIEASAAQFAYQRQWKLRNAPDPKTLQADGGPSTTGRPTGTESPLVGKPAPDFALDILGGKTFRLSEHKGKVVVLDFWATWCGPCLQAMPQVEKVAGEFKGRDVELIAVNLQEAPKAITAMLERHKLHPTVVLDTDGVVAERYGANAIPQTVVIDRGGNVARLFIGGGPHLGDQLREALNAVVAPGDGKVTNPGRTGDPAR